jgi:hypothetical protein
MIPTMEISGRPGNTSSLTSGFRAGWLGWVALVLMSIILATVNLVLYGNTTATIGLVGVVLFLGLTVLRPHISLVMFVFMGLAIEQFAKDYAWTKPITYFDNLGNIFAPLRGISTNPMEMVLALIIAGVVLRVIVLRTEFVPIIARKALFWYLGSLIFFLMYGLSRSGDFLPALWEVRGIFYMAALAIIVPQLIQTEAQVKQVVWAIILGVGFRALEISYHYMNAGFTFIGSEEGWGSHEDAGWWSVTIVVCIAMYTLKVRGVQRWVLSMLMLPTLLAIVGSDRRTAYPVLGAALVFFIVVQSGEIQKKILRYAWKGAIVFVIYLGAFWNTTSESILFMPVRSIREGLGGADETQAGSSYESNLYREVENYNLALMAWNRPITGSGYGVKIDYVMPCPIMWDLGFYIAHNQVLGVPAKTGIIGLAIFLFFYFSVMSEIGFGIGTIVKNPYYKAVLVFAGAAVTNHLLYGFFDIILTYYRSNIFLGTLIGLAAAVIAIEKKNVETPKEKKQETPGYNVNERVRWLLQAPTNSNVGTSA